MAGEKEIYNAGYRQLVARLREARKGLGLTQQEVADRLGTGRTWVAKIEMCELRLDLLHLVRLCGAYGLKARKVIGVMEE